jgi:predicted hydrocarbon binding protein
MGKQFERGVYMSVVDGNTGLAQWAGLGDIKVGRPNLGQVVPVSVYRSMQYSIRYVLSNEFGENFAEATLYKAGKLVGEKFCRDHINVDLGVTEFLSELKEVLIEKKIGILRIEKVDIEKMEFLLTIAEDLDCSGLPIIDKTVCNFDEGFISGIMKAYTGKEFSVKEIDCWGNGDKVCRFLINNPK